jgi:hypothetical protein
VIAIRRARLFDIDLVINRTLVYAPLTAILAGVFAALTRILQSLFLALTGAQSDAAVIISALVAAAAFAPIRSYLQRIVDERFMHASPASSSKVPFSRALPKDRPAHAQETVRSLMEQAVRQLDAQGGAVFWEPAGQPSLLDTCGEWEGDAALSAVLEYEGVSFGRLCLAARRNGVAYSPLEQESLQHAAGLVMATVNLIQPK